MYLLDTNVISELRNGKPKQSGAVRAWAAKQPASQLYLSAITVLELEIGVLRMERKDTAQGEILRYWLESMQREFAGRILPFTDLTAQICAYMHVPDPSSFRDSMIAATAQAHRFAVVTRNVHDFANTGVELLDPWVR